MDYRLFRQQVQLQSETPGNPAKLIAMLRKAKWNQMRGSETVYGPRYSQEWGEGLELW